MKTIKDFKELLNNDGNNTVLGMHMNSLFNESHKDNATVHHLEEKIEVMAQMDDNGINVFTDSYQMGSVSKAFYQWNLNKYKEFK